MLLSFTLFTDVPFALLIHSAFLSSLFTLLIHTEICVSSCAFFVVLCVLVMQEFCYLVKSTVYYLRFVLFLQYKSQNLVDLAIMAAGVTSTKQFLSSVV